MIVDNNILTIAARAMTSLTPYLVYFHSLGDMQNQFRVIQTTTFVAAQSRECLQKQPSLATIYPPFVHSPLSPKSESLVV
jgi:hypothetical protein